MGHLGKSPASLGNRGGWERVGGISYPLLVVMDIYEARGVFATRVMPPMLICRNCGKVTYPYPGQTRILCTCGKVYTLMAEGAPVRKIKV